METNKAIEFYQKHTERVKKYNEENRVKINEKMKQRYHDMKQNEAQYKEYLERKKQTYHKNKSI